MDRPSTPPRRPASPPRAAAWRTGGGSTRSRHSHAADWSQSMPSGHSRPTPGVAFGDTPSGDGVVDPLPVVKRAPNLDGIAVVRCLLERTIRVRQASLDSLREVRIWSGPRGDLRGTPSHARWMIGSRQFPSIASTFARAESALAIFCNADGTSRALTSASASRMVCRARCMALHAASFRVPALLTSC